MVSVITMRSPVSDMDFLEDSRLQSSLPPALDQPLVRCGVLARLELGWAACGAPQGSIGLSMTAVSCSILTEA